METSHPSTRAVNSGSGNRDVVSEVTSQREMRLSNATADLGRLADVQQTVFASIRAQIQCSGADN